MQQVFVFLLFFFYTFFSTTHASLTTLPPDAISLLAFKSKSDLDNILHYNTNERFDFCQWQGVKCAQGRVVRFILQNSNLRGTFPPDTLSRLLQLRTLNLKNNSLYGPLPDLSSLVNLKSISLGNNNFSDTFPSTILSLHRLMVLDLSCNNFIGNLPENLTVLDRLSYLRLDRNRFEGRIPPLNQTMLRVFNVSNNNLSGPVPVTLTLKKFGVYAFLGNLGLCGNVVNKPCRESSPFFNYSTDVGPPPAPLLQNANSQQGLVVVSPPSERKSRKKVGLVLGLLTGCLLFAAVVLSLVAFIKKRKEENDELVGKEETHLPDQSPLALNNNTNKGVAEKKERDTSTTMFSLQAENANPDQSIKRVVKSGNLVFCSGEEGVYSLEQLMRASAELLGRGTFGTTYKAVMVNQVIVSVKRLDAGKTAITSGEAFEQHLEKVGMLRHPNLVPVRAYFQAKQERLIIFDYQPNGSLFSLIHGSRSTRAKPLHWTSCLKIAEDVAQGLAYIHQASKFIHGNLKSTNVLLGPDFEACVTDYCLSTLADTSLDDDPDSAAYKAPEARKSAKRANAKSDVYSFGVLLLELLTGKPPHQHPFLEPRDMPDWVRAMREDDSEDDTRLGMLVEVASICSLTSHEQRPTMWQVLKMITNVKEFMGESSKDVADGYL